MEAEDLKENIHDAVRTAKVILEMMNDLEVDLRLTMELVSKSQDNQLLILDFTLWIKNRGNEDKPDSKIVHSFHINQLQL